MTDLATQEAATARAVAIRFPEFVALVAALMALGALGIDAMLPALPAIARSLHVATENDRQFVITVFTIGFGAGQLINGPLSDRYGRRPVLLAAIILYAVTSATAAVAASFPLLLIARFVAGLAVAATRVVTTAMVRDCYAGRPMARVMSFAAMVFMVVPILAPVFGQTIMLAGGGWRMIFWAIVLICFAVLLWFWRRMPETLHADRRHPFSLARLADGVGQALTNRWSLGYTLASAMLQGALFSYIATIGQITADTYHRGDLLVVVFATTAGTLAAANLVNARLVLRLGSRRISHSALVVLILLSLASVALSVTGHESLVTFAVLIALSMGCFGLSNSNFSAMAMTDMGAIAGTASSVQGFTVIVVGALYGTFVGQHFAGTTLPLHIGFLVAAIASFGIVAWVERGRLFRPA